MNRSFRKTLLCSTVLAAALSSSALAQEGPVTFEFSFSNPGARSMGMAGAFAALADDATAAYANPAGLTQLHVPEVSLETRAWSYETPFVTGGRISGEPSGEGIDTVSGIRHGSSNSSTTGLSYLSFIYPKDRWSFALYRHTWADFSLQSEVNGLFGLNEDGEEDRSEDILANTDVEVINTGFSVAYQIHPRLSLGASLVNYSAKLNSLSVEYAHEDESFYLPNPFTDDLIDTTYSYTSSTNGWSINAGFLWNLSENWSLGGFYREGPTLDFHVTEVVGAGQDEFPVGTVELEAKFPLSLPDIYGLGLAYRSENGAWTVSFEWSHIEYSSITDGLDTRVFDPGQIMIEDGDELRFGVEHVFLHAHPIIALRVGGWLDPAHSVGSGPTAGPFEAAIFPGGEDQWHWVGGLGFVFSNFQIDFGLDLSRQADVASLSFVYWF